MSAAADDGNRECYRCKGSRMCSTLDARWPAPCQVCRGTGRLEPPEPPKPSAPRKRDPSDPHAWYPIPEPPKPPASWKPAAPEQRKPYPSSRCECGAKLIPGRDHTCRAEYRPPER